MELDREEYKHIVEELKLELHATYDGSGNNLLVPVCPYCGHEGNKFGIYVGKDNGRKKTFMSHCFSCGKSIVSLEQLLLS